MNNKHILGLALATAITLGGSTAVFAKSHLPYPYNSKAANAQAMQWWTNQQIYGNPLGPGYANSYNPYLNQYANPYANSYVTPYASPYASPYGYGNPYYGSPY